jgi:hypothetical protein
MRGWVLTPGPSSILPPHGAPRLSDEKTRIVDLTEGFDFLALTIRQ